MQIPVVERFKDTYQRLNARSLDLLRDLYSADIRFQDPFRLISGLPALTDYFAHLYHHLELNSFSFELDVVQADQAVLTWTMSLKHPRLNGGQLVAVPGSSHIRFHDRIFYHRDYFDGGAMIYEQLPLIGLVIRAIKARI